MHKITFNVWNLWKIHHKDGETDTKSLQSKLDVIVFEMSSTNLPRSINLSKLNMISLMCFGATWNMIRYERNKGQISYHQQQQPRRRQWFERQCDGREWNEIEKQKKSKNSQENHLTVLNWHVHVHIRNGDWHEQAAKKRTKKRCNFYIFDSIPIFASRMENIRIKPLSVYK